MANGIIIDVGFTSDIKTYIDNLEQQLKKIDFQKLIGLSDAFDKEYQRFEELTQKIKSEFDTLGGGADFQKISAQMKSITTQTGRLEKSFAQLLNSIPDDKLAKMQLSATRDTLNDLYGIVKNTSDAMDDVVKTFGDGVKTLNGDAKNLMHAYKTVQDASIKLNRDVDKKSGLKNTEKIIGSLIKNYKLLQEEEQKYDDILNGKAKGNGDNELSNQVDYLIEIQKLLNAIHEINESDKKAGRVTTPWDNFLKGAGSSSTIKQIKAYANEMLDELNLPKLLADRLADLKDAGLVKGIDLPSLYMQLTKRSNEGITVPLILSPKAADGLYKKVIKTLGQVQEKINKEPLIVEVQLASSYQSKRNQVAINDIREKIKEITGKALEAGSDEEKARLTTLNDGLQELLNNMNKQIENALTFTVEINTDVATKTINDFVEKSKETLKELKDVTADEESMKLIDALLDKIRDISSALKSIAEPLKTFVDSSFNENIKQRNESLETLAKNLELINPLLDVFSQGIKKLDSKKVQENLLALTNKAIEVLNEATKLVTPMLPEEKAGEIKLTIANKTEILQEIAEVKNAMLKIFDPADIETWENTFLDALARIQTKVGFIFDPTADKRTTNLLSLFADDITLSDQIQRRSSGEGAPKNTDSGRAAEIDNLISNLMSTITKYSTDLADLGAQKAKIEAKKKRTKKDNEDLEKINQQEIKIREEMIRSEESVAKTVIEEHTLPRVNREHGGALTYDGRVVGLSGVDAIGSVVIDPENYERLLGITVEQIRALIHSHAGDIAWMPSDADFNRLINNIIPKSVTIAEKDIAITDKKALLGFLTKNDLLTIKKDESGKEYQSTEKLFELVDKYIESHDFSNDEEYKQFAQPFLAYLDDLKAKGIDNDEPRQRGLIQQRYALEKVMKEQFHTSFKDIFTVMSHERFKVEDPLGLDKGEVYSDSLNTINNKLQQIINILLSWNPPGGGGGAISSFTSTNITDDQIAKRLKELDEMTAAILKGEISDADIPFAKPNITEANELRSQEARKLTEEYKALNEELKELAKNDEAAFYKRANETFDFRLAASKKGYKWDFNKFVYDENYAKQTKQNYDRNRISFTEKNGITHASIDNLKESKTVFDKVLGESIIQWRNNVDNLLSELKSLNLAKVTKGQMGDYDERLTKLYSSLRNYNANDFFANPLLEEIPLKKIERIMHQWQSLQTHPVPVFDEKTASRYNIQKTKTDNLLKLPDFFKDKALSKDSKTKVPPIVYFDNYFLTTPRLMETKKLVSSKLLNREDYHKRKDAFNYSLEKNKNNISIPKTKLRIIKVPDFCSDFVCKKNFFQTVKKVHENYKQIQFLLDIVHYLKTENEINIMEKYFYTEEQRKILSYTYSFEADFELEKKGYDYMIKHKKSQFDEKDFKTIINSKPNFMILPLSKTHL